MAVILPALGIALSFVDGWRTSIRRYHGKA